MKHLFIIFSLLWGQLVFALDYGDEELARSLELLGAQIPESSEEFVELDPEIDKTIHFLGENDSFSKWSDISEEDFLSIDKWLKQRNLKDRNKYWLEKVTHSDHVELVGRVLKCSGLCHKYGKNKKVRARYQSHIHEGDEIRTEENSSMLILLVDGTIIRLSADSSVSLNEFNISNKATLSIIRLNYGHMSLKQRSIDRVEPKDAPESDLSFGPFQLLEANREYYWQQEYQSLESERQKVRYQVMKNPGAQYQYITLNKMIDKNNKWFSKKQVKTIVYSATASFYLEGNNLDLFYELGKKSYFYLTSHNQERKDFVQLRGYKNDEKHQPALNTWMITDENGTKMNEYADSHRFNVALMQTKRTPTVMLARELWIKKYSKPLFNPEIIPEVFAANLGYRLWDIERKDELKLRAEFAFEYIRRVETSNIIGLKSYYSEKVEEGFNPKYYAKSMKEHYLALRELSNIKRVKIKKMNRSQFYLWVLNNE